MVLGSSGQYIGAAGTFADIPAQGGGGELRGAFGGGTAYLNTTAAASVRYINVDGGSGGMARIAFRYVRHYNGGTANLIINGVSQSITVLRQGPSHTSTSSPLSRKVSACCSTRGSWLPAP